MPKATYAAGHHTPSDLSRGRAAAHCRAAQACGRTGAIALSIMSWSSVFVVAQVRRVVEEASRAQAEQERMASENRGAAQPPTVPQPVQQEQQQHQRSVPTQQQPVLMLSQRPD